MTVEFANSFSNILRDIVFIIELDILKISLFNSNIYIKLNESLRLNFKNLKKLIQQFPKE